MAQLETRDELSEPSKKKIAALGKKHAAEFRRLLGDPPNPDNVPDSFWARVQKENEDALAALLLLIFLASYNSHRTWDGIAEPSSDAARDKIAGQWVGKRAKDVAAGINERSIQMMDTAGRAWSGKTKRGAAVPTGEIDTLIDSIFGDERIDTIVHTEGQQAVVEGGDSAVIHTSKETGVNVTRYWGHAGARPPGHSNAMKNPCPVCSPREGMPESRWGGLWPGQCHPNCDCFVVYVDQDGYVIGTDTPGLRPGNSPGMDWIFKPRDTIKV